ncbi:MAG: protein kinase [Candidatus Eremiobacteraeota bacterium]|nr:protein kinase [Candidatus Eremiobacteraeota bacterium]
MDTLIDRTLASRYAISELIGRGGTADTYRALDKVLNREIAVKVLIDRSDDVRRGFMREAQSMARLNHQCIVAVYDVGEEHAVSYIVMELLKGKTLRDLQGGSLSYKLALTYLIETLEALDYAHDQGIIHRDVKPSNIMTVEDGLHVKLMDFGLSRRTSEMTQTTRTGQIVGTIAYLSPERFLSKPADVRSDLYSVGVVMYEIFTGTVPFRNDRDDLVATIFSHVHDTPIPPHEINRNIPPHLERVILKAIEKEPGKRYQSAREFIDDLRNLIAPLIPANASDPKTPRSIGEKPKSITDPDLRQALDKALAPSRNRNDAMENVLTGMLATRRRKYDEAKDNFLCALHELSAVNNRLEYAKTAIKYGTMILQKATDGTRDRDELRDGLRRLHEATEVFSEYQLADQLGETEYLLNALERTAIGL